MFNIKNIPIFSRKTGTMHVDEITLSSNGVIHIYDRSYFSPSQGKSFGLIWHGFPNTTPLISPQSSVAISFASEVFTTLTYSNIAQGNPLTTGYAGSSSHSSDTYAFSVGGVSSLPPTNSLSATSTIRKTPFANSNRLVDVGSLISNIALAGSNHSLDNAYSVRGSSYSGPNIETPRVNNVEKYPFASGGIGAVRFGNLTTSSLLKPAGLNSPTHGYAAGGILTSTNNSQINMIEKFPFATDTNSSDVGDLSVSRGGAVGISSESTGYCYGGVTNTLPSLAFFGTTINVIDKFPFATDANATDIGDLMRPAGCGQGVASRDKAYLNQGQATNFWAAGTGSIVNNIGLMPFSSETFVSLGSFSFSGDSARQHGASAQV